MRANGNGWPPTRAEILVVALAVVLVVLLVSILMIAALAVI